MRQQHPRDLRASGWAGVSSGTPSPSGTTGNSADDGWQAPEPKGGAGCRKGAAAECIACHKFTRYGQCRSPDNVVWWQPLSIHLLVRLTVSSEVPSDVLRMLASRSWRNVEALKSKYVRYSIFDQRLMEIPESKSNFQPRCLLFLCVYSTELLTGFAKHAFSSVLFLSYHISGRPTQESSVLPMFLMQLFYKILTL